MAVLADARIATCEATSRWYGSAVNHAKRLREHANRKQCEEQPQARGVALRTLDRHGYGVALVAPCSSLRAADSALDML